MLKLETESKLLLQTRLTHTLNDATGKVTTDVSYLERVRKPCSYRRIVLKWEHLCLALQPTKGS